MDFVNVDLAFNYTLSVKFGTLQKANLTFDANGGVLPSLLNDFIDMGSSTSYASSGGAGSYINNWNIYVDSLDSTSNDCYTHTRVYANLTGQKSYTFKFSLESLNSSVSPSVGMGFFLNNQYSCYMFYDPVATAVYGKQVSGSKSLTSKDNGKFATRLRESTNNKLSDLVDRLHIRDHVIPNFSCLEKAYIMPDTKDRVNDIVACERTRTRDYLMKNFAR